LVTSPSIESTIFSDRSSSGSSAYGSMFVSLTSVGRVFGPEKKITTNI